MSTITIRLPADKHERLKALAENRQISVNKLINELATIAIANHDARMRLATRAARGDAASANWATCRAGPCADRDPRFGIA